MDFITVQGMQELQNELKKLTGPEMESALRTAVMAGVRIVRDQAQSNFVAAVAEHDKETGGILRPQIRSGTLQRSIIAKRQGEESHPGFESYLVTVRRGGYGENDGYYAHWVEYGHWFNTTGKSTRNMGKRKREAYKAEAMAAGHVKFARPHPYMRPAFESKKGEAEEAIKKVLVQRIEEIGRVL